jgi:uncharacterized protein YjeT (DUF2065 family)
MASDVGVFFSFVFFLIGASYIANPKAWAQLFQDTSSKSYGGFLFALVFLPVGLVILSFHNNWTFQFALFITLSGWSMILKAIMGLLFPTSFAPFLKNSKQVRRYVFFGGWVILVLSFLSGVSFYW